MFSREQQTTARFDRESQKGAQADLVATRLKGRMNRWVEVTVAAGTCLVLFYGTREAMRGRLTPGDLIVFASYLRAMYKPVRRIAANMLQLSRATIGAARVVEILDTEPLVVDLPGAQPAPRFAGRVTFDDVAFGYGQGPDVLTRSRSTSRPARWSRSSAAAGPASRRSPASCHASTTRAAGTYGSTATTCATTPSTPSGRRSASSRRTPSCSACRSATTSLRRERRYRRAHQTRGP